MSITRQQRRAMQRKLKGISNEQADKMILAIREANTKAVRGIQPEITADVVERVKQKIMPDIRAEAIGDTLIMFIAWLHIDRKHTGKFLRKAIHEFNEFGDDLTYAKATTDDLKKILLDECGLDIVEEFKQCAIETEKRAIEKGRKIS